ncbi:alpha/beta hydrolase [Sphingomonas sp.]|uniref:alpha/beta hydrolase n=1 Tax=Sphingomonas sp. TaxID=28214 RepID=UPI002C44B182|nr:alpha/beta fold hydrolase [Sphingomonas sp.]HWK36860.1 alpha/beta fold hydrolase [Sphingomonas sp.]
MSLLTLFAAAAVAASAPVASEMTVPGPQGPLAGTLIDAGKGAPVVLVIPGSGPTDRDGNNPLGVTAATYRLLADALAERGVSSVRIDKRGLFGSKAAVADPNAVTVADYAGDAHAWVDAIRARTGADCVWLLGHSEGGLVALQAAQDPRGLCGVILVATAGRRLGAVMREQLNANPANAPILPPTLAAIDSFEAGRRVDPATLPAPVRPMFSAAVQGYLIDMFAHDPAKLTAAITLPVLIVQGERDIQVAVADARALKAAAPKATLTLVPAVNHVLKAVESDDRAANIATYRDPSLPVAPGVVDAVAGFVTAKR